MEHLDGLLYAYQCLLMAMAMQPNLHLIALEGFCTDVSVVYFLLQEFIGDYVALAVSDTTIFTTHHEAQTMPGVHAGLTAEECRIPLIVLEK